MIYFLRQPGCNVPVKSSTVNRSTACEVISSMSTYDQERFIDMMKLQVSIRLHIMKADISEDVSHQLAADLFHIVMESAVVDEEYIKSYQLVGEETDE